MTFDAPRNTRRLPLRLRAPQIGDAIDTARGDVLFWLEAAARTLASHRRDLADLPTTTS